MKKELKYTLGLVIFVGLFFLAKENLFSKIYNGIQNIINLFPVSYTLAYVIVGIPLLVFVYISNQYKFWQPVGLRTHIFKAILIAFIFTLPMLIGSSILGNFEISIDAKSFWLGCVFAAFFEELYFRGLFFGQLFKRTSLGFIPAIFLSALIFASLHLYQSNQISTLIGIFITTFMGSVFFAWLYVEWNYNLWISIGMHFFMNLSWGLFTVSDNAFGDLYANIARGLTIALAITATVIYKKKHNLPFEINKQTLFKKNINSIDD